MGALIPGHTRPGRDHPPSGGGYPQTRRQLRWHRGSPQAHMEHLDHPPGLPDQVVNPHLIYSGSSIYIQQWHGVPPSVVDTELQGNINESEYRTNRLRVKDIVRCGPSPFRGSTPLIVGNNVQKIRPQVQKPPRFQ